MIDGPTRSINAIAESTIKVRHKLGLERSTALRQTDVPSINGKPCLAQVFIRAGTDSATPTIAIRAQRRAKNANGTQKGHAYCQVKVQVQEG